MNMFGKWMFYISLVLALILIIENMAYRSWTWLLFIWQASVSTIAVVSVAIWFWIWFWLKTFLLSEKNSYDDDNY